MSLTCRPTLRRHSGLVVVVVAVSETLVSESLRAELWRHSGFVVVVVVVVLRVVVYEVVGRTLGYRESLLDSCGAVNGLVCSLGVGATSFWGVGIRGVGMVEEGVFVWESPLEEVEEHFDFQKRRRLFFFVTDLVVVVVGGGVGWGATAVVGSLRSDLERKIRERRVVARWVACFMGRGVSSGVGGRCVTSALTRVTTGVTSLGMCFDGRRGPR
jgi:hypothetical protein